MHPILRSLACLAIALIAAGRVFAAPAAPPETAVLQAGPGVEVARAQCSICHSADFIATQPPGMGREFWKAELGKMKKLGAPFDDSQAAILLDYLVKTYGNERGSAAATAAPVAMAAASSPQQLLQTSGCLGCHAVDHKIVGPAYRDVAARYAGQADARAMLIAKLKSGGSGHWGAIPMPPQSQLADAQAGELVDWVLRQK